MEPKEPSKALKISWRNDRGLVSAALGDRISSAGTTQNRSFPERRISFYVFAEKSWSRVPRHVLAGFRGAAEVQFSPQRFPTSVLVCLACRWPLD